MTKSAMAKFKINAERVQADVTSFALKIGAIEITAA